MNTYTSLHNHTAYSNLRLIDSINKVEDLIEYAYKIGLHSVAITDHESISAHHIAIKYYDTFLNKKMFEKYVADNNIIFSDDANGREEKSKLLKEVSKKFTKEQKLANVNGFKLILGNEIYLAKEGLTEATFEKGEPFYHVILIARDEIGHKQIRELSSRAWTRGFFRNMLRVFNYPSDLFDVIGKNPGHIVCSTACLGGYPGRQFALNNFDKIDNFIALLRNLMGPDNFYIELQPQDTEDQRKFNTYMINKYWGEYPFIFTTDSHFLSSEDREIHRIFLNSKSSNEREIDEFYASAYMMSYNEVCNFFDYISTEHIEEMARNTIKIGDMCSSYSLVQPQVVPKIQYGSITDNRAVFLESDVLSYENIHYYATTNDEADAYFCKLLANGWIDEQVPAEKRQMYLARLDIELSSIKDISTKLKLSLSDYFITMNKMIDIIWNEADSLVGASRGSAGGFLTNYLLGITQMNPLEQGLELPYWRFLHKDRPGLPDIDIDTEAAKRVKVFNKVQEYFKSIGGDLVNVCTFGTEGSKSALRTAARGLALDQDVVTYLVSMIPNERGFDWTLDQCYYGDEDHTAITKFKEEIDKYESLWAVARKIEGLVTRLGVHASGVIAVNGSFIDHNSFMKTSKEVVVSAFDLHDSEDLGLIKYDFLTISALDRIRQTLNYLLEDTAIYWQGSLKKTYDKYISPKIIDYTDPKMWDMVANGSISSLFQFDTVVGFQAIRKIQPRSLVELAISNSVMRLMSDGELPLEVYARYKHDINSWYTELTMNGILEPEVAILEKHLLKLSGVADSQESLMMLVMDPQISGFTMEEANLLRKTIAKKQFDQIDKVHEFFNRKGSELNTRQQLLDYVWNVQVSRQLGYSFSSIHTMGYSILAIQEMNLAYHFPIIYWNCACLSTDSSAINEEDFYNLMDEGIVEISNDEDIRTNNKTDYAKIASAMDKFKRITTIQLPDINNSRLGFTPDIENNAILYGLKGITRITSPVIQEIMTKRPYTSLNDFVTKVTKRIVTKDKIVNLIKAGAFTKLEHKNKKDILVDFILSVADQKKKLTLSNANMLFDYDLIPEQFTTQKTIYKLTKQLRANRDDNKIYYILSDDIDTQLLRDIPIKMVSLENDRVVSVISSSTWDAKVYEPEMAKLKTYITTHHDELLTALNQKLFQEEWDKYASGDELQWELDSLNFYYSGHPLIDIEQKLPVAISDIKNIQEGVVDGFFLIKGKEIPRMRLYSIIGTVLDKDTTKGVVTIQTPNGVINVKFYKDLFALYNHAYNYMNNGKTEEEESFFEKGTHLLITGILRGETFIPKVYKNIRLKPVMQIILDKDNHFISLEEKTVEDPNNVS